MKADFVRKERSQIIKRVTEVLGVLDYLLDKDIFKGATYNDIKAEKTREDKIRKLHETVSLKGKRAMATFYDALKKQEPLLLEDLSKNQL